MADPIRERILQELDYALSQITTANGFHTNAGSNRERGRKQWEPDDPPCLSTFAGVENSERKQYGKEELTMPYTINLIDDYAGYATAEQKSEVLVADLREIMHGVLTNPEGTLAKDIIYRTGGMPEHPEKSKQTITVLATFDVIYQTKIGDPYNQ